MQAAEQNSEQLSVEISEMRQERQVARDHEQRLYNEIHALKTQLSELNSVQRELGEASRCEHQS